MQTIPYQAANVKSKSKKSKSKSTGQEVQKRMDWDTLASTVSSLRERNSLNQVLIAAACRSTCAAVHFTSPLYYLRFPLTSSFAYYRSSKSSYKTG